MNKTKIEWSNSTWNPVTGCLHGCEYCYARKIANRFGGINKIVESAAEEGIGLDDVYFRNPEYFYELDEPVRNSKGKAEPYPTNFYPAFHRYRLDIPQKWKDPRTIFVCSMADLFGDWVPNSWIEEVIEACRNAPQHSYLFLTKNVKRYAEYGVPTSGNMWYG
ncbi:MAG: phage Gp37/Gp68 family protein, partial [Muribaculaceae bacterium]|nr:phage Gp37/Gp68 family protein [Muribaculaceae bacterium]